MAEGSPPRWPLLGALCAAAALSAAVWMVSVSHGAHLWHFDAKAHLVVARRVFDNITPGWRQLGAIWLPLPHMLNAIPAQSDLLYRTGLFASGLSYVAFLLGISALGHAVARATGDSWAGVVAVAVPALNPGWLYLQSTPLTEPLFLGLACGSVLFAVRFADGAGLSDLVAAAACSGAACLVRYEAWPFAALLMSWTAWRARRPRRAALALGLGLLGPILFYGIHAWAVSGIPFHAMNAENLTRAKGELGACVRLLLGGGREAFGAWLPAAAALSLAALGCLRSSRRARLLAPAIVATLAPASVTLTAYLAGHPEKARYVLLLAPALALALAAATAGRRWLQAAALVLAALQWASSTAPLAVLEEASLDRTDIVERAPVVAQLRRDYAGGRLLVSLASLAPVVFETRIPVREFVHEGNVGLWEHVAVDPAREVAWVLIAEGDALDRVREYRPAFPESFVPVMRSGRVTIYRRAADLGPRLAGM